MSQTSQTNDIVREIIGDWGRWQNRAVILIYLCKIPSAWFMACVIFTAPTPNPGEFYCHQPQTNLIMDKNVQMQQTYSHNMLHDNVYNMDFCKTYNRTYNGQYEEDILVPCTSFQFESGFQTVVTKFSLVCSRSILIAVAQFSHLFGVLTGGILAKILMKTISPRKLMLYGMLCQIIAGCLAGLVPYDYEHLMLLRYLAAVCCAQMYTAGQVLFTDITDGIHRTIAVCLFETFWSVGVILLPLIAYINPNWSSIFLMISLPTVLYIPLWFLMPDTPRWFLKKGRIDEAEEILRQDVYINNTRHLITSDLRQRLNAQTKLDLKEPLHIEWSSLWTDPQTILYMAALHIAWAVFVTCYNGMLLNVKTFGREYLSVNTVALGFSEIIGVFIGLFLILKTEKKWKYAGIFNIFAGLFASLGFLYPDSLSKEAKVHLLMLTAIVPKVAVSCSQSILFACTTEFVRPEKKNILVFSCVVWSRIWLLAAPFIGALTAIHQILALSVFGLLSVVGGIATSVLSTPRTVPRKPPKTVLPIDDVPGRIFSIELTNISINCTLSNRSTAT